MRSQGVSRSDIVLVVLDDRLDAPRRESFRVAGKPIEALVHDPETLVWFADDDVSRGRPTPLVMIARGVAIGAARDRAERLPGLLALAPAKQNARRCEIADLVDDLHGDRPPQETLAIGAALYPKLVE